MPGVDRLGLLPFQPPGIIVSVNIEVPDVNVRVHIGVNTEGPPVPGDDGD